MIKKALCMIAVLFFGTLLVVSCDQDRAGPELEKPVDLEEREIVVTVTFYENQDDLIEHFFEYYDPSASSRDIQDWSKDFKLLGFALTRPMEQHALNPTCDIHQLEIRGQDDTERKQTLGHELLHCLYGEWHPDRNHH